MLLIFNSVKAYRQMCDSLDGQLMQSNQASIARIRDVTDTILESIYVYSYGVDRIAGNHGTILSQTFSDFFQPYLSDRNSTEIRLISRKKNNTYPDLMTIIKPVAFDEVKYRNYITGAVLANINVKKLGKVINKPLEDAEKAPMVYILNKDGIVMYSSRREDIGKASVKVSLLKSIKAEGEDFIETLKTEEGSAVLSILSSNFHGFHYISVMPRNYNEILLKTIKQTFESLIFAILGGFLITLVKKHILFPGSF